MSWRTVGRGHVESMNRAAVSRRSSWSLLRSSSIGVTSDCDGAATPADRLRADLGWWNCTTVYGTIGPGYLGRRPKMTEPGMSGL